MACFFKSHSVAAAVADLLTLARPVGTMVLNETTGVLSWSTAAGAATYAGVAIDGNVNIASGSTLTFDT